MTGEYDYPVIIASDYATKSFQSFVQTSGNVIVEVIRRY